MTYLNIHKALTTVTCASGQVIPCNYLEHIRFRNDCDFCAGLHYLFVEFASGRSYSKCYEVRKSINLLLGFITEYENKAPTALHLTSLNMLSAEVFRGFSLYCQREKAPKNSASRLKGAFDTISLATDDGIPILTLPSVKEDKSVPREPLSGDGFSDLTNALKSHLDVLLDKLEFRKRVQEAKSYTIVEIRKFMQSSRGPDWYWEPSDERAFKTLQEFGHPLGVSLDEYIDTARNHANSAIDPLHAIYQRYGNFKHRFADKKAGRITYSLDNLFQRYYPNSLDQAVIVLFLMLQTGWNKETVLALDSENYLDIMTGALSTDLALIFSEKQKSQSTKLPFFKPKTFLSSSSKKDKYSSYNLIEIAKKLSSSFNSFYLKEEFNHDQNTLFLCIRSEEFWLSTNACDIKETIHSGRFSTISNINMWTDGIKKFLRQYNIYDNGSKLTKPSDLAGRLRPTWIRFVRDKKKKPLSIVALEQGHSSVETTDIHYDNSGVANRKRKERLIIELESLVKRLREGKFKGLLGVRDKTRIDTLSLRFFTIPGHENSLWACSNSYKPDWPGSHKEVSTGQKCSSISKCLFCSQVCIFEDSLPYLLQREINIQNLSEESDSELDDELKIIRYILDEWGDEQALINAARYQRRHPLLLPGDFRSLSILFEEDE